MKTSLTTKNHFASIARGVAVALAFTLAGCTIPSLVATQKITSDTATSANDNLDKLNHALTSMKSATREMEQIQSSYLGGHRIKTPPTLPASFANIITLNQDFESPQALMDCLQSCPGMPGIPAQLANDTPDAQNPSASPNVTAQINPTVPNLSGMNTIGQMTGNTSSDLINKSVRIRYTNGSFTGLLDHIALKLGGIHWKYANHNIQFNNIETKTFVIYTTADDSNSTSSVSSSSSTGGASSGGSSGGTNGPSASIKSKLSVWDDLKAMMPLVLSPTGKFFISNSMGTITITDKPSYIQKAEEKINEFNSILSLQALIQIKVFKVTLTDGDQYAINWNLVFNSLSKNTGMSFINAFPTQGNTGSFGVNILKTAGANNPNSNIAQIAGSSAMINALSTQGRATLETSGAITTTNNQVAPLKVGNLISYPATSQSTATAAVGTTSTVQANTVSTGFTVITLPHILDNHRMVLSYALNLSSNTMDIQTNNGITTKYPNVAAVDSLEHVFINSGETLILSGFEQTGGNLNQQGIGSASNWLFGGGVNAGKTKDIVVIMITPVIAEKMR